MNWKLLTNHAQLEDMVELSKKKPVLLFKHSTRCSISAVSLNRLERKWKKNDASQPEAYLLDLIAYRDLSETIAEHFQVDHQSPQVILIQDGVSVYDTSHFEISFEEIINNIKSVSA